MNRKIMIAAGFKDYVDLVDERKCPFCKTQIDVDSFRDELSLKEHVISGLCQLCQDEVFGK